MLQGEMVRKCFWSRGRKSPLTILELLAALPFAGGRFREAVQIDGQRVIEIEIALRQPGIVAQVEQLGGIAVPAGMENGDPILMAPQYA